MKINKEFLERNVELKYALLGMLVLIMGIAYFFITGGKNNGGLFELIAICLVLYSYKKVKFSIVLITTVFILAVYFDPTVYKWIGWNEIQTVPQSLFYNATVLPFYFLAVVLRHYANKRKLKAKQNGQKRN